jgi:hypothetical protein
VGAEGDEGSKESLGRAFAPTELSRPLRSSGSMSTKAKRNFAPDARLSGVTQLIF